MQDKPLLIYKPQVSSSIPFPNKKTFYIQHVSQPFSPTAKAGGTPRKYRCYLFSIPGELLVHIAAYVGDPISLLALSLVNRRLRDLLADDNTWYRAFVFHFWGKGPESYPGDEHQLVLRKSESTWKKEFIKRFDAIRRWQKSRSATLSYQPHWWSTSGMHLLDNMSLMTSSLQYGIVTRSFPLTGKILKGYLDASGTTNGFGIGNPNEEFSPNVSCIALSSCGGTGRVAWGFRGGEVAVTSAPRVMDHNRPAARFSRCRVEDEHAGDVCCVVFAGREEELIISGCSHGQVKLWDTRHMQCLWMGWDDGVLPDPCVKVGYCGEADALVAAFRSGDIMVWCGMQLQDDGTGGQTANGLVRGLRVPRPTESTAPDTAIDALFIDPNSSISMIKILVHYGADSDFFRLTVDPFSGLVAFTRFADGPFHSPIHSLRPFFVVQENPHAITHGGTSASSLPSSETDFTVSRGHGFILTGDALGKVHVWNWDVEGSSMTDQEHGDVPGSQQTILHVAASHRWEAYEDVAVSAIEANNVVIITGSSEGILKVWDCLSFAPLRTFASPVAKSLATGQWEGVGQIILRDELLVASGGCRILVWQAGAVPANKKKSKAKHSSKPKGRGMGSTMNKWQQQIELNRDIRESKRLLDDERVHAQRNYDRARSQNSTLDQLGLSEAEAVEYVLMLSREEEQRRGASVLTDVLPSNVDDDMEGVFVPDGYSDVPRLGPEPEPTGQHRPLPPPPPGPCAPPSLPFGNERSRPGRHVASSASNAKVSAPGPEPAPAAVGIEFGGHPSSSSGAPVAVGGRGPAVSTLGLGDRPRVQCAVPAVAPAPCEVFPAMGMLGGTAASSSSSLPPLQGSWSRGSASIGSRHSADGELNGGRSDESRLGAGTPIRVRRGREQREEEELRFAIELSLAEARSREEQ